jgi:hypothetical protein
MWNEHLWNEADALVLPTIDSIVDSDGYLSISTTSSGLSRIEVWRFLSGETPVCLSRTHYVGEERIFSDYNVASGKTYSYFLVGVDASGTEYMSSISTGTLTLSRLCVHQVAKNANNNIDGSLLQIRNQAGATRDYDRATEQLMMPAKPKPVVGTGAIVSLNWTSPLVFEAAASADLASLRSFASNHSVLCVRDQRGAIAFATLANLPQTLDTFLDRATLEVRRTDYKENVAA